MNKRLFQVDLLEIYDDRTQRTVGTRYYLVDSVGQLTAFLPEDTYHSLDRVQSIYKYTELFYTDLGFPSPTLTDPDKKESYYGDE